MLRVFLLLAAGLLLAADGLVGGLWTNRWQTSPELAAAVARMDKVPMNFGAWRGKEGPDVEDWAVRGSRISGFAARRYERRDGSVVNVLLVCGRPGPMSVHTPEVCYRGVGYQILSGPDHWPLKAAPGGMDAELWKIKVGKPDAATPMQMSVLWSWTTDGTWQTPNSPRFTFAGKPVLYKLYVTHEIVNGDKKADEVCREFLRDFLPELNPVLFRKR